jgi:hypothetical protein
MKKDFTGDVAMCWFGCTITAVACSLKAVILAFQNDMADAPLLLLRAFVFTIVVLVCEGKIRPPSSSEGDLA